MRGATQKKIQPISYTQLERNLQSVPAMREAMRLGGDKVVEAVRKWMGA